LTDNTIKEIEKQLKKRRLIKIKMLRAFFEGKNKKEVAKEIAEKTNSILIDSVGFVVVLLKKTNAD
jgi:RNA-binding protein